MSSKEEQIQIQVAMNACAANLLRNYKFIDNKGKAMFYTTLLQGIDNTNKNDREIEGLSIIYEISNLIKKHGIYSIVRSEEKDGVLMEKMEDISNLKLSDILKSLDRHIGKLKNDMWNCESKLGLNEMYQTGEEKWENSAAQHNSSVAEYISLIIHDMHKFITSDEDIENIEYLSSNIIREKDTVNGRNLKMCNVRLWHTKYQIKRLSK